MMDQKRLGKEIEYLRKELGLSQHELANKICTQAQISRIERGEFYPRLDTFYKLAIKLRVTVPYLYSVLLRERTDHVEVTVEEMIGLKAGKDYEKLYHRTKNELKNPLARKDKDYELWQFLNWHYLMGAYYVKKMSYDEVIEALETLVNTKDFMIQHRVQDLRIKNLMANIHAENEAYDESILIYQEILVADLTIKEYLSFQLKVYYNYAKTLCKIRRFHSALDITNEGLQKCAELKDLSILGNLFFQKGICFEEFGFSKEKTLPCFQKALMIFEILGNKSYMEITQKNINDLKNESTGSVN